MLRGCGASIDDATQNFAAAHDVASSEATQLCFVSQAVSAEGKPQLEKIAECRGK